MVIQSKKFQPPVPYTTTQEHSTMQSRTPGKRAQWAPSWPWCCLVCGALPLPTVCTGPGPAHTWLRSRWLPSTRRSYLHVPAGRCAGASSWTASRPCTLAPRSCADRAPSANSPCGPLWWHLWRNGDCFCLCVSISVQAMHILPGPARDAAW